MSPHPIEQHQYTAVERECYGSRTSGDRAHSRRDICH